MSASMAAMFLLIWVKENHVPAATENNGEQENAPEPGAANNASFPNAAQERTAPRVCRLREAAAKRMWGRFSTGHILWPVENRPHVPRSQALPGNALRRRLCLPRESAAKRMWGRFSAGLIIP